MTKLDLTLKLEKELCSTCKGEGYIGTGYNGSFVDIDDAMECPECQGVGFSDE